MSITERCGVCGILIQLGHGVDRGDYLECDRCAAESLTDWQAEERRHIDRDRAADIRAQNRGRR